LLYISLPFGCLYNKKIYFAVALFCSTDQNSLIFYPSGTVLHHRPGIPSYLIPSCTVLHHRPGIRSYFIPKALKMKEGDKIELMATLNQRAGR
jgi:hypothetical protein